MGALQGFNHGLGAENLLLLFQRQRTMWLSMILLTKIQVHG